MSASLPGTRPPALRGRVRTLLCALALGALAAGCDDGNTPPDGLPFGRVGQVRIEVLSPLGRGDGELRQSVIWGSEGPWQLTEQIYYKSGPTLALGDETVRKSTGDPGTLAVRYANWIGLVNQAGGALELFRPDLPPALVPACSEGSTITVQILDRARPDSVSWTRCGVGSLGTLSSEGAGPGPTAARVVEAARLLRDFTVTLDRRFNEKGYAYTGSLPFRTIARGEHRDPKISLFVPRVIDDAATWSSFWAQYMPNTLLPPVDFNGDLVLVAAVGTRQEVGDSVEVRRILATSFSTQVNLAERRPGDFCTPAPRAHAPFHIVVAPRDQMPRPIIFSFEDVDQVPCG